MKNIVKEKKNKMKGVIEKVIMKPTKIQPIIGKINYRKIFLTSMSNRILPNNKITNELFFFFQLTLKMAKLKTKKLKN